MILEHVDRRVLGALRFLDAATGQRVNAPLLVQAPGLRMRRNQMGDYVIFEAPGLEAHTTEFLQAPDEPPVEDVEIELTIRDPAGEYLPQQVVIDLPRDPDIKPPGDPNRDRADALNSVFRVIEVPLYLAPAARVAASWALVRGVVVRQGTTETLAGALIRVINQADNAVLARGLSDDRGEALVAVPGVHVTNWNPEPGPGPVMTPQTAVTIEVIFDPEARGLPNPRDLEDRRAELITSGQNAQLTSGQTLVTTLPVNLP
jgi:hypothetical protein